MHISTTKRRYGLDWPADIEDPFIELTLAKKWMLEPFCHGNLLEPGEHMLRAIRALFTPEQWKISPWTEEHAHAWAGEEFSVWLGGASCSKSNDAGGLAVLDWMTDPTETYIALASTSVPMLKLRSFESVIRYFRILKAHPRFLFPGKESASQTAIINVGDDDTTDKASIRGVALADGDEARAVARLAGSHLPYVTMILDEGAALPPAAANARFNARAGTRRFRFLSLANPIDRYDEATKFCAPKGGWETVDENTGKWRSNYGLVLHRNGFKSPAIEHPEEYPFLINQKQLDDMLRDAGGNRDDPLIWRMAIGFPLPLAAEDSVLSPATISAFAADKPAVWLERPICRVAGLDPAFTSGGDKCILQVADVGVSQSRELIISFLTPIQVPIEASNPRPVEYQISDYVLAKSVELGFSLSDLAVDDSGTQSIASIIQEESGVAPIRVNFGARATPLPNDPKTGKPPRPRYRNKVTELWYELARLVREGKVRNLPPVVARQMCSRRYRRDVTPLALESKVEYKSRHQGRSPDEADALVVALEPARKWLYKRAKRQAFTFQELLLGPRTPYFSQGYSDNAVDINRYSGYISGELGDIGSPY